jgi:plasmid stabilization system protein ParE
MIRRLVFRLQARSDIAEAMAWYETQGKGLGADFLRAVEVSTAAIEHNPYQYQKARGEVRRVVLRRFPYSLIYVPSDDEIVVLACVHGRRNPARWQERT